MLKRNGTFLALAALALISYHNLLRLYYTNYYFDGSISHPVEGLILQHGEADASNGQYAYVFYATTDIYACSALVNVHQLQALNSTIPIHVLVSEDVPKMYIEAFEAVDVTVHVEPTPRLPVAQGHYYEACLVKLIVFKMHKLVPRLKRILFIDSDQLVMAHFDNLFSDIPVVDVAAPRAWWLKPDEATFSSAFMLISLSDRLWDKINQTIEAAVEGNGPAGADMDIMNELFWDTTTILSGEYVTLNSPWEDWALPNWFHPREETADEVRNRTALSPGSTTSQADDAVAQKPVVINGQRSDTAEPAVPASHAEDSDIYRHLVQLHEYTPIIHFTALGKPWTYTLADVARRRPDAHPLFAVQFGTWRTIAKEVCPNQKWIQEI